MKTDQKNTAEFVAEDEKTNNNGLKDSTFNLTITREGFNAFKVMFGSGVISEPQYIAFGQNPDESAEMENEEVFRYLMEGTAGRDLKRSLKDALGDVVR